MTTLTTDTIATWLRLFTSDVVPTSTA